MTCRFELIRALIVFSSAASSYFTTCWMISEIDSSSLFISLGDFGGVSCTEAFLARTAAFGFDFDLVDDYFELTMIINV